MCILLVKPKNITVPSDETLQQCFKSNPDGAGIAYCTKDRKIVIKKGLMTVEQFIDAVHSIPLNSTALIHCRISTAGGVCPELTHPYPLSGDFNKLLKTTITLSPSKPKQKVYSVGHNGIFYGKNFKLEKEKSNDSQAFIINYLTPLKEVCELAGINVLDEAFVPTIDKVVDGSRVAIIDNDNNFKIYGNGWIYDNGIYYSNGTYKSYTQTYKTYNYSYYNDDYSWIDDDYDYNGNLIKKGEKKKDKEDFYKKPIKAQSDEERLMLLIEDYPQYEDLILEYFYDGSYPVSVIECWIANGYLEYELEEREYEKKLTELAKGKKGDK